MNEQQKHIFDGIADGKSPGQMAKILKITEDQVKSIMSGLNLNIPSEKSRKLSAHELAEMRHTIEEHRWATKHREEADMGWL